MNLETLEKRPVPNILSCFNRGLFYRHQNKPDFRPQLPNCRPKWYRLWWVRVSNTMSIQTKLVKLEHIEKKSFIARYVPSTFSTLRGCKYPPKVVDTKKQSLSTFRFGKFNHLMYLYLLGIGLGLCFLGINATIGMQSNIFGVGSTFRVVMFTVHGNPS